MVMNFEHIATRIPMNVPMTFRESILYKLGFKDRVIDKVMSKWALSELEYFYEGVTYVK
tara:strand:- start:4005 stop:4181 length:177 start_codon:yes stop_codon:yes gene_type:complete